jgi:hypothetical protein
LNGADPKVIAQKLTAAGIDLLTLGYTAKDVAKLATQMNREGFIKFFSKCFAAGTKVHGSRLGGN